MVAWLGYRPASSTVYIPFNSFAAATGASSAVSNFVAGDVLIYKDGSVTQRSSSAGITANTSFDSQTGLNSVVIDLSDNTDAGFYAAGHHYDVAIADITIDTQTVRAWIGSFDIGPEQVNVIQLLGTAWLTPGTAGTPDVNVKLWNALTTVALPLVPTTAGRTLDVSATGEAGVDWANVGSPTTSLALTGTTIAVTQKVDVDTIKTNPVVNAGTVTFPTTATLASTTNITAGTITTATNVTTVNGLAANVITATSINADAITDAKVAADVTIASVTGAVGSVTGAVGSVTGLTASDVGAIKTQTDKFVFTVANVVDANALRINGDAVAAADLAQSADTIVRGTCSGGTTTTAIVSTLVNPASLTDAGQLIGRTIIFKGSTGTANVQGQASNITGSTTGATPTITFTAMTTAPANGDTFAVL